jgi:hypothetical protein
LCFGDQYVFPDDIQRFFKPHFMAGDSIVPNEYHVGCMIDQRSAPRPPPDHCTVAHLPSHTAPSSSAICSTIARASGGGSDDEIYVKLVTYID